MDLQAAIKRMPIMSTTPTMQQWVQQTQSLNRLFRQNRSPKARKPNFSFEKHFWNLGNDYICAIDEAGRGALAGPLVSAAIILPKVSYLKVDDSKKLNTRLKSLYEKKIKKIALDWAIGIATLEEINQIGIQNATYLSYRRAIEKLSISIDLLFVDHFEIPSCATRQFSLTKGDEISASIASASIIAKQTRDNIMRLASENLEYRDYGFSRNFGYGTKAHFEALNKLGPSDLHRTNFYPIDEMVALRFDL